MLKSGYIVLNLSNLQGFIKENQMGEKSSKLSKDSLVKIFICAMHACLLSRSGMSARATLWTVDSQAPPSIGFSRHKNWSGLLCLSPGDLPNPGIELRSVSLQVDSLPS